MRKQLEDLRNEMQAAGIHMYMITMDDDHQSEYVGAHYKEIEFVTGFTGSAGTLVVTPSFAGLWTDGRYFIQAQEELKGSGIELERMGTPGVPSVSDFIVSGSFPGMRLGFNGRCVAADMAEGLQRRLARKNASLQADLDLPALFWKDRPLRKAEPVWILKEGFSGQASEEKLRRIRESMDSYGAEAHMVASLDDIAWILNLRGNDIPNNPVFISFLLIERDRVRLFIDDGHLTPEVRSYLGRLGVETVNDCEGVYAAAAGLKCRVLLEKHMTNFLIVNSLPKEAETVDAMLPSTMLKCRKNDVEADNLRKAQLKDSLAVTRFMYYFKQQVQKGGLTEWGLVEKLHEFRSMQEGFLEESFETISAWGEKAAICHYSPSREKDRTVEPRGLYLVDSGGHYYEGTTDITRTFSCGPVTKAEKESFTLCVMANLRLAEMKFPEGTSGVALDGIARKPFWDRGLNYDHGTGHGVGYLLGVHERPAGIRYRIVPERIDSFPMGPGVYVSDEPGLYFEGSHGVRIENMLLCVPDGQTGMCRFETLTLCPMDRSCLERSLMEDEDVRRLNEYHAMVCEKLSPLLPPEEKEWLEMMCRPL